MSYKLNHTPEQSQMATVYYHYPQGPERAIGQVIDHNADYTWILVKLTHSQLPPTHFLYEGSGYYRASGTHNLIPLTIKH